MPEDLSKNRNAATSDESISLDGIQRQKEIVEQNILQQMRQSLINQTGEYTQKVIQLYGDYITMPF